MSFALVDSVQNFPGLPFGEKSVLTTLATFANAAGICWPANSTVAKKAGCDERTVRRHVETLKAKGLIERVYREGRSAITKIIIPLWEPRIPCPPPRTTCPPESVNEPKYQITAVDLATAPEPPPIVVFESEHPETPPVEPVPVIDPVEQPAPPVELSWAVDPAEQPAPIVDPVPAPDHLPVDPVQAELPPVVDPAPAVQAADAFDTLPPSLLADLALVRKAKKRSGTVTHTEKIVLASEAQKAGITVQAMIKTMILKNWARFSADWIAPQAPQTPLQRPFKPEPIHQAAPAVIEASKAALSALRPRIIATVDPLRWAKQRIADHQAGKHVSGFALRSAKAALKLP